MMDRAETARVSIDRHVVRRIGEHHRGALVPEQLCKRLAIECVATQYAMRTEDPQVPHFAQRRASRKGGDRIGRVVIGCGRILEGGDPKIDLADLEADGFDVEVETDEREFLQLLRQQAVVPG